MAVTVALDGMGGDDAPAEMVAGAKAAAAEGVRVLITGVREQLEPELSGAEGVEIVDAPDVIGSSDEPAAAVRAKPDSSMVAACRLVRDGSAEAAVSAGPTGAMLAASLLHIGRIRGISRPGIAAPLPAGGQPCVLIDAGATVDARAEHLLHWGLMGSVFMRDVMEVERPSVGLLSVGEEPSKGNALTLEAHQLLAAADLHFTGNCEGRDALRGDFRVIVADGFSGNVMLKSMEGAGSVLFAEMREAAMSSLRAKLGALLLRPALRGVRDHYDPERIGGAYLLGVRGLSVIAHGSSSRRAIVNAIQLAARGIEEDVVERMERGIAAAAAAPDLQDRSPVRTVPAVVDPENGERLT